MGSEFYAYFVLEGEKVSSRELEELAHDAGAADLPSQEGSQVVARLEAASRVRQGEETELWFNTEHLHLFDPESGESLLGRTDDDPGANVGDLGPTDPGARATRPREPPYAYGRPSWIRWGADGRTALHGHARHGCPARLPARPAPGHGARDSRPGCAASPTTCARSSPTTRSSRRSA